MWMSPPTALAQLIQESSTPSTLATLASSTSIPPLPLSTSSNPEPVAIASSSIGFIQSATSTSPSTTNTSSAALEADAASLLNYYFIFVALFLCFIALAFFYFHRRSKLRRERFRNSVQNALARDLDGWVYTRRWVHGSWRPGDSGVLRREDGLNEHGEAPPPYAPAAETGHAAGVDGVDVRGGLQAGYGSDGTANLAVPLQTYAGDGRPHADPPEYQEAAWPLNDATARDLHAIELSVDPSRRYLPRLRPVPSEPGP
ncbi:hypothetical protein W97_07790 [Coniosporium apollinis CBS 100218]|uniref:Uncharacterized protein n=1 Tax=Coniosporium apollinis (strain CBS 100218) TaxID=1168221 RepID=R7Z301_CONA1|nr:uncharacterized protein W97_07790 [Coniosporium apollinis CBS 100218]EON68532.1 hypothetical protein W97_07790 [Coniosporium apollinis CBS 100218]